MNYSKPDDTIIGMCPICGKSLTNGHQCGTRSCQDAQTAITAEELVQQMVDIRRELEGYEFLCPPLPSHFAGMPVFEAPPEPPKIQLSNNVTVSDEFRSKMDAWLLKRFGRRERLIKRNQVLYARGLGIVVTPETMSIFKTNAAT